MQRYEGASTLYGPHQLAAYINLTVSNLHYLRPDATDTPDQGELPLDNRHVALSFIPGVVFDGYPPHARFGSVLTQPLASYGLGAVVNVTFQGANPRNDLRLGNTFAAVERRRDHGAWTRVRDDSGWFLVYTWRRTDWLLGHSEVHLSWETYGNAEPGTYRFKYYGDAKQLDGSVRRFEGTSKQFDLL